jgi:hypothetical protein
MPNPFNLLSSENQQNTAVNTTSQATLTFAAAPAAVTLVWRVLSTIIPSIASGTAFPIILSLVVGMVIYASAPQPTDTRQKASNFFLAFINSFALAATTLGISSTLSGTPTIPIAPTTNPASTVPTLVSPTPSSPISPSSR